MANTPQPNTYTCFDGRRRLMVGPLWAVAAAVRRAIAAGALGPLLVFDNRTGRLIDLDMRDTDEALLARLSSSTLPDGNTAPAAQGNSLSQSGTDAKAQAGAPRGRGRPKLGVVPREVTLLPRHWEWLAAQAGGASVALRKLVEEARRTHGERDRVRLAQERAYHFMAAMAGDLPGFEEAIPALFANDAARFNELIAAWPGDVGDHVAWLAFSDEL